MEPQNISLQSDGQQAMWALKAMRRQTERQNEWQRDKAQTRKTCQDIHGGSLNIAYQHSDKPTTRKGMQHGQKNGKHQQGTNASRLQTQFPHQLRNSLC
jgi:hypothetical protein